MGPEGSITKARTNTEPVGERSDGGALGDPVMCSLSAEREEEEAERK